LRALVRDTPRSSLFPYTTLFRSAHVVGHRVGPGQIRVDRVDRDDLAGDVSVAVVAGGGARIGVSPVALHVHRALAAERDDRFSRDRKRTRLNSSHDQIAYAGVCS